MAISTGQPILPADLDTMWSGVTTVAATISSMRTEQVVVFSFDGVYQDSILTNTAADQRLWIPVVDGQIVSVVVNSSGTIGDAVEISLSGRLNKTIELRNPGIATTERTEFIPTSSLGVIAGDTITVRINASIISNPLNFCNVSIKTRSIWTKQ